MLKYKMNNMLDRSRKRCIFTPMNKLPLSTRTQIINLLVEGNSLRATARITGVSRNTVDKLLVEVGQACEEFHNNHVVAVASKRIQCDEIWSFVGAKEKNTTPEMKENGLGDVWTWTALDADSKLIVSWYVGDRSATSANEFMQDVASRLKNRVQLTSDGYKAYLDAVEDAFSGQVDFAQLVKMYGAPTGTSTTERKYSPQECTGAKKVKQLGNPDKKHISTSHVERQNLTMRMHMRRFTRLTNAFSKKIENHCYAIALHFVYYNFAKIHTTLRVTPAMEAGLTKDIMSIEDIVKLTDK
jgi:IS1 family transposase